MNDDPNGKSIFVRNINHSQALFSYVTNEGEYSNKIWFAILYYFQPFMFPKLSPYIKPLPTETN